MWWRVPIAIVILLFAGLAIYWFAPPRRGTLAYHQQQYVRANELRGIEKNIHRAPIWLRRIHYERRSSRIAFHQQALIDARYLEMKVFVISNRPPSTVASFVVGMMGGVFTNQEPAAFPLVWQVDKNSITVVGPAAEMDKWDEMIREADVPYWNVLQQ